MARFYAAQQVGVLDGTKIPADRADGRQVGAKKSVILASKVPGTGWAAGDVVVLGKLAPGEKLTAVRICTDTSLGSSTIAIGIAGATGKYVAARTFTTPLDAPTVIGPKASTLDDAPLEDDETILLTVAVATIASGTLLTIELEICSVK